MAFRNHTGGLSRDNKKKSKNEGLIDLKEINTTNQYKG
jgi:hypothetical protein